MDLIIQYEDCSIKCSPNDYDFTSHIHNKLQREGPYLQRVKFEGHYDNHNYDASELRKSPDVVANRRGRKFVKKVNENGTPTDKNFYRYLFIVPLNHGLASDQVLPAGIHVRLSFHRANARRALVNVTNAIQSYEHTTIPIHEPTLHLSWAYSRKLEQDMDKVALNGMDVSYLSSHIRYTTLDGSRLEYTVPISQGPVPKYIVFFLMSQERFSGDLMLSSTKFQTHDLQQFSLLMDNDVMPGYPLKEVCLGEEKFQHEFYRQWLLMTDRFGGPDDDIMTEEEYLESNFMIVETFDDFDHNEGLLSAKLNFCNTHKDQLLLCWMPVTEKVIKFSRNLSANIQ